jgi:hypothetical protein
MDAHILHRRMLVSVVILFGLACLISSQRQAHFQRELSRPYGGYNAEQILTRTRPLAERIYSDSPEVRMLPEPIQGRYPAWQVLCKEGSGSEIGRFVWACPAGELVFFGNLRSASPSLAAPDIGKSRAISSGREWLKMIQQAGNPVDWKLLGAPLRLRNTWCTRWQSNPIGPKGEKKERLVVVDRYSGQLIFYGRSRPQRPGAVEPVLPSSPMPLRGLVEDCHEPVPATFR